jgi:protease-4
MIDNDDSQFPKGEEGPESNQPPETQPEPQPEPESSPEPEPLKETPSPVHNRRVSDAHPIKRKLVMSLVGLYAVSVLSAAAVLWRSQSAASNGDNGKDSSLGVSSVKSILSKSNKDAVGVMAISGPIYSAANGRSFEKGVQQWRRKLIKLAKRKDVKAIVIKINSPGGSVGAVQELYTAMQRVRKEHDKPIVAHLGDVAASGGYYLAATCDRVVAHPGTLLGSIGVIFNNVNAEGLLQKVGVKSRVIKSGKMKDIGSMSRPMTKEERELLQALIDNAYGQFLGAVVKGRKLPEEHIRPLADGRIFTGEQALENGLIDQLGDSYSAILLAAKLGGIKDKKPKVVRDGDSFSSIMELLDSKLTMLRSPELGIVNEFRQFTYHGLEYRW